MSLLPPKLSPPLTDREAVSDALYRLVTSLDTGDEALLRSFLTDDVVLNLSGTVVERFKAVHDMCFSTVAPMDTTHHLTNMRVNTINDTAHASCSALAQHFRPGEGLATGSTFYLAGARL